jgi:ubiquitin-conjugating enzyme E2 Q
MEETQTDGGDDDFGVIEDTYGAAHVAEQTKALKRDFIEIVANGFRPGLVRFGSNDFVVIASLPLVKFPVPPTALAAWDGRLISPDLHLTLLISGFRGAYPPLNEQGHVASAFAKLRFNVGLSVGKPSKEAVEAVTRDFAMKEEEIFVPDPPGPELPEWDEDDPDTWVIPQEKPPTPEPIDPGRFERFSLTTSLNSALNDMFLPVLQLRLKYGIGWAGAELLHAEITARQITEADALDIFSVEVAEADDEERFMKGLPLDPLKGMRQDGHLNLPLIAYSYLVRRFVVRLCLGPLRITCESYLSSSALVSASSATRKSKLNSMPSNRMCATKGFVLFNSMHMSVERLLRWITWNRTGGFYSNLTLQYEIIHNSTVVDLLVSLACCGALEGQLSEGLPVGIGLRVSEEPSV